MQKYKTVLIHKDLHARLKIYCYNKGETVAGKITKILTEVLDREDKLAKELLKRETVPVKKTLKESNEEITAAESFAKGLTKERGELSGDDYV